jgi:hypothetical protein
MQHRTNLFICNSYFLLDLTLWYFQYKQIYHDTENYHSVWRQTHYDITGKTYNISFEGILTYNVYYHISSYRSCYDVICLNLHNCLYYIYIYILTIILYTYIYMHTHTETGQKPPGQKAPHNEIIIQSYYIFFIFMVILKIS